MQLLDFSKLFEDGKEIITAQEGKVILKRHHIGDLHISSGEVIACDPFTSPDVEPFTVVVTPGTYPLILSVANYEDEDQRVAGAMLRISNEKAMAWQMALQTGQGLEELEADEIFGHDVDSGTSCMMDADAAQSLMEKMEADESYFETIIREMDKTYVDTWSWANISMNEETKANMIAFSSGMGDGLYASYFGFDASGNVVSLITDFALFDADEMA
jgi:hypothetical protein